MRKKTILLLVPNLEQGGQEKVCLKTAQILSQDYRVFLLVFDSDQISYELKEMKGRVRSLRAKSKKGVLGKCWNVAVRSWRLKQVKKKLQADLCYSFGSSANLVNVLSKGKERVWIGIRGYSTLSEKRKMVFLGRKADLTVCCSQELAREVQQRVGIDSTCTLTNPCDVEAIQLQAAEVIPTGLEGSNCQRIMAVGRIHPIKGYWHLLKSMACLQERGMCIQGYFVGETNGQNPYDTLVKNLHLEQQVQFVGGVANPFVYMAKATVFVLSSIHEGFPNALLEAMSLGIPVVAAHCKTGPAELLCDNWEDTVGKTEVIYGEYGVLVPPFSPEENLDSNILEPEERILADVLEKLLQNEEMRSFYSKQARKRAKQFRTECYAANLKARIEQTDTVQRLEPKREERKS